MSIQKSTKLFFEMDTKDPIYARLQYLYQCYIDQQLSESELQELRDLSLSHSLVFDEIFGRGFTASWAELSTLDPGEETTFDASADKMDDIFRKLSPRLGSERQPDAVPVRSIFPQFFTRFGKVAVAILFITLGAIWWYQSSIRIDGNRSDTVSDVGPGGNRAVLTLPDGRQISLDEAQSAIHIGADLSVYYENGTVVTDQSDARVQTADGPQDLCLQTPRGGSYRITLADGSTVWLNSASTLRYPSAFNGPVRTVELEGEAYFEVAAQRDGDNPKYVPFHVVAGNHVVEVLGTHFNVQSYPDDPSARTTLIEGRVRIADRAVKNGFESVVLTPGEQAIIGPTKEQRPQVVQVDLVAVTAWKDNLIAGSEVTLADLIGQIERWYDVEFVFSEGVSSTERGLISIDRHENLSAVLKALENTYQLKFIRNGKEVLVVK